MANEVLKIDSNNKPVIGAVTDDSSQEIRMARIDDTTKGLKVMIVGGLGAGDVTGPASSTNNAIVLFNGTTGKIIKNSLVTISDTGIYSVAGTTENMMTITTSFGSGSGSNLVYIEATNALYDRPLLRIIDSSVSGGAANIRIDSPNPDIEMVETDQVAPAGVFEIAVNSDKLQLNGRNSTNTSFEPIATFARYASGGMMGLGTQYDTPNAMLEIVQTGSLPYAMASSAVGANSGDIFNLDGSGNVIVNDRGNAVYLRIESDTDQYNFYSDGTNDRIGVGTNTPLQKLHVKGRAQFGVASNTSGTIDLANSGAAGLTRISPGAPGSDITLILPATADTLVGKATTDALTNKTVNGLTISTTTGTFTLTNAKTLSVTNTLTLSGTDSTTMTFPSTTATIARTDAAQTFTGAQTYSNAVLYTNNAITASANAATVPVTAKLNTVTNNSAATLTITMATASATDGQMTIVRILDFSAVAQTITWVNTENSTVTAPTTSNGSTTLPLTVGFMYNSATSKWRCIASA